MFRKLLPTDADQLRRHLLALTPTERRMRFHGAVADSVIERRCRRIDWFRTVAVGYVSRGGCAGQPSCISTAACGRTRSSSRSRSRRRGRAAASAPS